MRHLLLLRASPRYMERQEEALRQMLDHASKMHRCVGDRRDRAGRWGHACPSPPDCCQRSMADELQPRRAELMLTIKSTYPKYQVRDPDPGMLLAEPPHCVPQLRSPIAGPTQFILDAAAFSAVRHLRVSLLAQEVAAKVKEVKAAFEVRIAFASRERPFGLYHGFMSGHFAFVCRGAAIVGHFFAGRRRSRRGSKAVASI